MRSLTLIACLFAVIVLFSAEECIGQITYVPITSAKQAEQQARKLMQIFNWNEEGIVRVIAPSGGSIEEFNMWHVDIGDYSFDFDGITGQLQVMQNQDKLNGRNEEVNNIDKKLANTKAMQYLTLAGLNFEDTIISESALRNFTTIKGQDYWCVRMTRFFKGYPFEKDSIMIDIDPIDGDLLGLGYSMKSPLPKNINVYFSNMDAAKQAEIYFQNQMGEKLGNVKKAELMIVTPDNYLENIKNHLGLDQYKKQTITRLAWVIEFDAPRHGVRVFVDAENGKILSGAYYM